MIRRELSPRARVPLFAAATVVIALLLILDPAPRRHAQRRVAPAAAPPVIVGGSAAGMAAAVRPPSGAVRAGRRFLRLYARLQVGAPDSKALRDLRSLTTLALGHTLLAQPPQAPGGGHGAARLTRVRVERLSSSALLLHGSIRRAGALLHVHALVQRDRGRWVVTALSAVR